MNVLTVLLQAPAGAAGGGSMMSVSYTHLDVYKRQTYHSNYSGSNFGTGNFRNIWSNSFRKALENSYEMCIRDSSSSR